jgi:hypothetical protein
MGKCLATGLHTHFSGEKIPQPCQNNVDSAEKLQVIKISNQLLGLRHANLNAVTQKCGRKKAT